MIIKASAIDSIIVESELDAMLINQKAGGLVNIVALGALSLNPDHAVHDLSIRSRNLLIAFDSDVNNAGAKIAWGKWGDLYPFALRCPVPEGKDPTDAARKGIDIEAWIIAALTGGAERMKIWCPR